MSDAGDGGGVVFAAMVGMAIPPSPLIPAEAGIQFLHHVLDSRLRGNEQKKASPRFGDGVAAGALRLQEDTDRLANPERVGLVRPRLDQIDELCPLILAVDH